MKNYRLLIYTLFIGTVCCISVGCSDKQQIESTHFENENFYMRMEQMTYESFKCDVASKSTTKGGINSFGNEIVEEGNDVIVRITPTIEVIDNDALDLILCNMNTLNDLKDIVRDLAAELTIIEKPAKGDKTVIMSNVKIKESLAPMTEESKNYLRTKGMSNEDIRLMLEEQGADETALIPFTLAMVEAENNAYYAWLNAPKLSLIPCAYAMNWERAGHCALVAMGVDITGALMSSTVKVWTKAAIKKAFKCAAQKAVGPAGAAIAIVEFANCMWF